METLTIRAVYKDLLAKIRLHLSVLGKRATNVRGEKFFVELQMSLNEEVVFFDLINASAERVVSELSDLCSCYSTENGVTFIVRNDRWRKRDEELDGNLTVALEQSILRYLVNAAIGSFLASIFPGDTGVLYGRVYLEHAEVIMGNVKTLAFLKRPASFSGSDYGEMLNATSEYFPDEKIIKLLTLKRNGTEIGSYNGTADRSIDIRVPEKVSELENDEGYIRGISGKDVTDALGYEPLDSSLFVREQIVGLLSIKEWALAETKPKYRYTEIEGLSSVLDGMLGKSDFEAFKAELEKKPMGHRFSAVGSGDYVKSVIEDGNEVKVVYGSLGGVAPGGTTVTWGTETQNTIVLTVGGVSKTLLTTLSGNFLTREEFDSYFFRKDVGDGEWVIGARKTLFSVGDVVAYGYSEGGGGDGGDGASYFGQLLDVVGAGAPTAERCYWGWVPSSSGGTAGHYGWISGDGKGVGSVSWEDITGKPSLFSGDYNELRNKPTIPVVPTNVSAFVNDSKYITADALTDYLKTEDADRKFVTLDTEQTIIGKKTFSHSDGIRIGDAVLKVEGNRLTVTNNDGKTPLHLCVSGDVVAYGNAAENGDAQVAYLSDLEDVTLGSLSIGDVLKWDGGKWVNGTAGLDTEAVDRLIASALVPYALKTEIPSNQGTVKSVGLSVPTGLSVSNTPITDSGILSISFADGYSIPTNQQQDAWSSKWDYDENTIKAVKVNSAGHADTADSATSATSAVALAKDITLWGIGGINAGSNVTTAPNLYIGGSKVMSEAGVQDLAGIDNLTMVGKFNLGDAIVEVKDNVIYFRHKESNKLLHIATTGDVVAYSGLDVEGLGLTVGMLNDVNISDLANGHALVWNGEKWVNKYVEAGINENRVNELITASLASYYNKTQIDGFLAAKASATDFNAHAGNKTVHITAAERTAWNAKADASAIKTYGLGISGDDIQIVEGGTTKKITVPYAGYTKVMCSEAYLTDLNDPTWAKNGGLVLQQWRRDNIQNQPRDYDNANIVLNINGAIHGYNCHYGWQLAFQDHKDYVFLRRAAPMPTDRKDENGNTIYEQGYDEWRQLAFIDSTVANATKFNGKDESVFAHRDGSVLTDTDGIKKGSFYVEGNSKYNGSPVPSCLYLQSYVGSDGVAANYIKSQFTRDSGNSPLYLCGTSVANLPYIGLIADRTWAHGKLAVNKWMYEGDDTLYVNGNARVTSNLRIGDAVLTYDSANKALAFTDANGQILHLTTSGDVVAYAGANVESLNLALGQLSNVTIDNAVNGQSLVYRDGTWVAETVKSGIDKVEWKDLQGTVPDLGLFTNSAGYIKSDYVRLAVYNEPDIGDMLFELNVGENTLYGIGTGFAAQLGDAINDHVNDNSVHLTANTLNAINNGVTAYGWGDHASAGYLKSTDAATTYLGINAKAKSAEVADALASTADALYVHKNGGETITGAKTFDNNIYIKHSSTDRGLRCIKEDGTSFDLIGYNSDSIYLNYGDRLSRALTLYGNQSVNVVTNNGTLNVTGDESVSGNTYTNSIYLSSVKNGTDRMWLSRTYGISSVSPPAVPLVSQPLSKKQAVSVYTDSGVPYLQLGWNVGYIHWDASKRSYAFDDGLVVGLNAIIDGNLTFATDKGTASLFPSHYYHQYYNDINGVKNVYFHAYPDGNSNTTPSSLHLRVGNTGGFKELEINGGTNSLAWNGDFLLGGAKIWYDQSIDAFRTNKTIVSDGDVVAFGGIGTIENPTLENLTVKKLSINTTINTPKIGNGKDILNISSHVNFGANEVQIDGGNLYLYNEACLTVGSNTLIDNYSITDIHFVPSENILSITFLDGTTKNFAPIN